MDIVSNLASAFGLASSAGLNAYIPLLVVSLLARFPHWITLRPPFDVLTDTWVIVALLVLVGIEAMADKVPGVDHLNDIIGTIIRPAAGAILFASSNNVISDINPALAAICGLVLAGGVHAVKATARPVVTLTTAGLGNPFVSMAEDAVAAGTSVLAVVAPLASALFFIAFFGVLVFVFLRWRARRRAASPT